jgi:glycolate oxidase FAD binding subunit
VRFVDGAGRILKNGGRVMKNVTGYDLVKLMAGSWGTLGVMTELSFKVTAQARAEATLVAHGLSVSDGVAAMIRALGSAYDVSGAAFAGDEGRVLVRLEGLPGSVDYRAGRLQAEALAGFEIVTGDNSAEMWRDVRDVRPFVGAAGAVWRLSVKPTDAPGLCDALTARGVEHRVLLDWGGGLMWLLVDDSGHAAAIRDELAKIGGHATLIRGTDTLRAQTNVFQPEPAPIAAISAGLRAKFDPKGILNPGLMG